MKPLHYCISLEKKKKKKKKIYKKNKIMEMLLYDTLLKMLNFQAHLYW